jgi:hypothetical protein
MELILQKLDYNINHMIHKWVTVYTEVMLWMLLLSQPVMNYCDNRSGGQPNTCSKVTGGLKLAHNRAAQFWCTPTSWFTIKLELHNAWLSGMARNGTKEFLVKHFKFHVHFTVGVRATVEYRKTCRTTQLHTSHGRCGPNQLIDLGTVQFLAALCWTHPVRGRDATLV